MLDGVLVIKKEKDYTSHDVVAKLRGILHMKKIGHTGTLDPQAEGVLPVVLGKATRLVDLLTEKEKTYEALLHLGIVTDTQDMTGKTMKESPVDVTEDEVRSVIKSFLGEQQQIPPMYSAIKVDGRKLYELAREGKTVERKARTVFFHSIEIKEICLPLVRFSVTCSKGTYIRTLCNDIGNRLGCGGCMEDLLRTRSGNFTLEESLTLDQVSEKMSEGTIEGSVISIEEVLKDYPRICCDRYGDRLLLNGNGLPPTVIKEQHRKGWIRMCNSEGIFVGIYQWNSGRNIYQPVKMFL
ncbi:tRNA pseudouridine(55) synthase TruB [Blautia sp. HCP28S3_G10]|uniref:tRNA pseudouridine(55) synthase TruB n=1 Tax=Blautia sp. HCP28S3_G10 TaxID=3438908 RepID=UPI003F8AFBF3